MKKLIGNLRAIIKSRSGETLMEGIISLLLFTILIATVTMMLNTAMHITGNSNASAESEQEKANAALIDTGTRQGSLVISDGNEINVTIPVNIMEGDYIAWQVVP